VDLKLKDMWVKLLKFNF